MIEGTEFFVILLVALVVLGPQRLPEMARKVGRWTAEMRRAANELRQGLESEVGDVREIARDIREPLREVQDTVRDTKKIVDEDLTPKTWVGPKPISGPTPDDAMADLERIRAGEDLRAADAAQAAQPESGSEPGSGSEPDSGLDSVASADPDSDLTTTDPVADDRPEPRAEGGAA